MNTLTSLSIVALALGSSAAVAQDEAPVLTSRVIIGQLEQLPVGEQAPCDKDNIGRLSLEISADSSYRPMVTVCVQKERWGQLEYANENKILTDDYAGRKISSQRVGSAVVWNGDTERVEGFVLGFLVSHASGLACTFQSEATQGSGSCGIQWKDSEGKDFLVFQGSRIQAQLAGHAIDIPLSAPVVLDQLPAQTPDDLLSRLKAESDPDKRSDYLFALSTRIKRLPLDQQIAFVDIIHGLVKDGTVETRPFHSFLGNLGLEYGVSFARELLNGDDVDEVREGLGIIRQVRSAEVLALHVDVFKRFYPKAVDVGSAWGDFASAGAIRDVLSYLRMYGTNAEKEQIRAIRDATVGTMREVDNYLKP